MSKVLGSYRIATAATLSHRVRECIHSTCMMVEIKNVMMILMMTSNVWADYGFSMIDAQCVLGSRR